jgi:hypothetical protein
VNAAQKFVITREGQTYDAKAVLIRAARSVPGWEPLAPTDFDGTIDTVARPLRRLGYVVRDKDNSSRRFWWVNQNKTHEEFEVGFI